MIKQVSDELYVSPQLAPDDEEPGQPRAAASAVAAAEPRLTYTHIPIAPKQYSLEQVRTFQATVSTATSPVLAHCKTRTRSASHSASIFLAQPVGLMPIPR